MPINELLIREFDKEMLNTKKTLERVPLDKWDWKPHEKSGSEPFSVKASRPEGSQSKARLSETFCAATAS
jgi:hypothetical protein